MRRLIAAEALKLRTTRTFYGVSLGALALVVVIVTAASLAGDLEESPDTAVQLLGIAGVSQTFAMILGLLAVTTEFRHGTITATLLVTPSRRRLLAAKFVAHTVVGFVLGALAFGAATAIILGVFSLRDVPTGLSGTEVLQIAAGGTAGAALSAAVGVGIGALVRNQVGAIVAALAWLYAIEPLLGLVPGIDGPIERFGFVGLSSGLSATPAPDANADLLGQLPAGLVMAGYALVLLAAGAMVLRRRDVTA